MGFSLSRLFERFKKPKHEFVAYAVMLSWHPGIGFAALDPLSGRHIAHRPGTTVINNFPPPTKLAADYFPVTLGHGAQLPRELAGRIQFSRTVSEQVSANGNIPVMVERYEMREANAAPFVFQRSLGADGSISLEASYGSLSHRHEAKVEQPLHPYIEALRGLAQRMLPGNKLV